MILAIALSYLVGSIPTAYLLVRWFKRQDIRTFGSGNVGATNAGRAAGPVIGLAVLALDLFKGVVGVRLLPAWLIGSPEPWAALLCGLAAVIGHDFPCWLKFRGGKGVATTFGVLLAGMPVVAATVIGVWVAVFVLSRYVSIASMAAGVAIPCAQIWQGQPGSRVVLGAALAVLILVRHRGNVQRLLAGAEHRAWSSKNH